MCITYRVGCVYGINSHFSLYILFAEIFSEIIQVLVSVQILGTEFQRLYFLHFRKPIAL